MHDPDYILFLQHIFAEQGWMFKYLFHTTISFEYPIRLSFNGAASCSEKRQQVMISGNSPFSFMGLFSAIAGTTMFSMVFSFTSTKAFRVFLYIA